MSMQEDRLAALEQKVADIELERLYEKRKAAQSTSSEQAYDAKQVNYRLTMLLGIASGQEQDIGSLKKDVGIIKEQIAEMKQNMNVRFETQDKKLDQLLQMLTTLTTKTDE